MTRVRSIATVVASSALMLTGACLLWFSISAARAGNSALLAVCVAGAILLIFAATIDRFESVKGLGVEAKTRQLDQKLLEADRALDQLRQLAETLGTESVAANSKLGRLDSAPTPEESYVHAQAVKGVLLRLGSQPDVIRRMLRPFVHMMLFDLTSALLHPVTKDLNKHIQDLGKQRSVNEPEIPSEVEARRSRLEEAYAFKKTMVKDLYTSLAVEDYPSVVLARLSRLEIGDPAVRSSVQQELLRFSTDMLLLRSEGRIEDTASWFSTVDRYHARNQ